MGERVSPRARQGEIVSPAHHLRHTPPSPLRNKISTSKKQTRISNNNDWTGEEAIVADHLLGVHAKKVPGQKYSKADHRRTTKDEAASGLKAPLSSRPQHKCRDDQPGRPSDHRALPPALELSTSACRSGGGGASRRDLRTLTEPRCRRSINPQWRRRNQSFPK